MQAIYNQALPPSGHEHAVSLRLTPKTVLAGSATLRNVVLARSNKVEIFDVVLLGGQQEEARLQHVRTFTTHGTVTGLQRIRTLDTAVDGKHRLLVSFKDAKVSMLEWSSDIEDLVPVSLHSYERLPEVLHASTSPHADPKFRTDPLSRCAALQLPLREATLALLPLFQDALDLPPDSSLPYAPSMVLPLTTVDPGMLHLIDYVFLHGFTEPTLAILYTPYPTWAGRIDLPGTRDEVCLAMVTLDLTTSKHAIISLTTRLPFDATSLVACPKELGGAMVLTGNAIIHVDQSSKVVGTALTGWHARTSALPLPPPSSVSSSGKACSAENSFITFLTPLLALFLHSEGDIYSLAFMRDGKSVTSISLSEQPLATGTIPSAVERVGKEFVYVSSATGPGLLLRWSSSAHALSRQANGQADTQTSKEQEEREVAGGMDNEDEDLYGSSVPQTNGEVHRALDVTADNLVLAHQDTLDSYGPIRSLTVGIVSEDTQPELVAATGGMTSGSLTVFHRGISPRKRRKLDGDVSQRPAIGAWELPDSTTRVFLSGHDAPKTSVVSIDSNGSTEYSTVEDSTLAAGIMQDGVLAVRVTSDSIIFCSTDDLKTRQSIHIGSAPVIEQVQITDGFILIRRNNGELTVYQADETVISPKPLALPASHASTDCASLFHDSRSQLPLFRPSQAKPETDLSNTEMDTDQAAADYGDELDDLYNTDADGPSKNTARGRLPTFFGVQLAGQRQQPRKRQYLVHCSKQGTFEILSMPERQVLFQNHSLRYLPNVLHFATSRPEPQDPLEDSEVEQICLFDLGKERPLPALAVLLVDGSLAVYKALWDFVPSEEHRSANLSLAIRFVKCASHNLDFHRPAAYPRQIIPAQTPTGHHGLFVTGEQSFWILASDHGPTHVLDVHQGEIKAFLSPVARHKILYAGSDSFDIAEVIPVCFDSRLPWQIVNEGKAFTSVVFDRPSESFVGAALYQVPFVAYDEERNPLFKTEDPTMYQPTPTNHRSTLELFIPGSWELLDGYEFRVNESVLCMQAMQLESKSTPTGFLDVIAVGTAINQGEDATVKGALYVFEVVRTNSEPEEPQKTRKLRLRSMEDQKSSVAHMCEINGYLCHCVGLKIYVKGFDLDERLVSLAFLDVGIHTTSLRSLKNFILVGDVQKGITFVAFQEDPFKLQALGKDYRGHGSSTADFLVHDGRLAFVVSDRDGILRLIEYNPYSIETRSGDRLLNRTEMRMATEVSDTLFFSKRTAPGEVAKQSGVLQAGMDGSLYATSPVREVVYKRLQLLERQLQRHGLQFGGLNPRGFRTVQNAHVSRPLVRGLLDGDLLQKFWSVHALRQAEMAEAANSDPDTIKANLSSFKGPW